MTLSPSLLSRRLPAWLALALVLAPGCKKKPPEVVDDQTAGDWGDVTQALQLVAVSPETIPANAAAAVRVLGAGFQQGATARVGTSDVQANWLDENTLTMAVPPTADGVYDVTVRNPDGGERTLRGALTVGAGRVKLVASCRDVIVYFALDQAGVTDAARRALDENVACYAASHTRLRVEGHADERGTTDYNVALGQRRADSVRMHLVRSGVPTARIDVVSYGEERPAERGSGEAVWAKNRRVEVRLER